MTNKPRLTPEQVKPLLENKFVSLYDLQYAPDFHYFNASRRRRDGLIALKDDAQAQSMLPDAVSCVVVVSLPGQEPRLLLSMEYRYPAGRFLLSVPAGLIDPEDRENPDALRVTAIREIQEETGLTVQETDTVTVINPCVYSSPGMTDECNALVGVHLHVPDLKALSQSGALGTELFDGFVLLTRAEAQKLLATGRDPKGDFYSVYTFAALCWFVAGF